jgi:hypothetical protein
MAGFRNSTRNRQVLYSGRVCRSGAPDLLAARDAGSVPEAWMELAGSRSNSWRPVSSLLQASFFSLKISTSVGLGAYR